jgi:hypothetical protein
MTEAELEQRVKELALLDTKELMKYIDPVKLQVCDKRKKGLSYGQIAQALKMPRSTVQDVCRVCGIE